MFAPTATLCLLALMLLGFILGRWRYDVVALTGLGLAVLLGLVPEEQAFLGFSHPAVVTVAAVLVLSRGLAMSGATDAIARLLAPRQRGSVQIAGICGLGAALSSVMNNVGALALLLPVASASQVPAGQMLMPLGFATILGGLITAIGTPPNLIVSAARGELTGQPFGVFAFVEVGLVVAVLGVAFVAFVGWRLMPDTRIQAAGDRDVFEMEDYLAEARVPEGSRTVSQTIAQLDPLIAELDAKIVGLIRKGRIVPAVPRLVLLQANDILMIEVVPRDLQPFLRTLELEVVDPGAPMTPLLLSDDVGLVEAIVVPGSELEHRTVLSARLQRQYGVNLLAVSRQGQPYRGRLRAFRFAAGDVLLLQGEADRLHDVVGALGCLPLAERGLRPPPAAVDRSMQALGCFVGAIALAAFGIFPIAIALMAGVFGMLAFRVLQMRHAYEAIDWPIIVLLGGPDTRGRGASDQWSGSPDFGCFARHHGRPAGLDCPCVADGGDDRFDQHSE